MHKYIVFFLDFLKNIIKIYKFLEFTTKFLIFLIKIIDKIL
jgi:hypothetical protein